MAKRHDDALFIQHGACNPSGVSRSLVRAIDEVRNGPEYHGTVSLRTDPAIRLILHQLTHLAGMWVESNSIYTDENAWLYSQGMFSWDADYDYCIAHASEATIRSLKMTRDRVNEAWQNITALKERIERVKAQKAAEAAAEAPTQAA